MSTIKDNERIIRNNETPLIFKFEQQEDNNPIVVGPMYCKLWQIIPSICVLWTCLPFGIMLGWPSPTYIYLLSANSSLPITLVQSPMIAGFLMFGNIFATPFSNVNFYGSKQGILVALVTHTVGWTVMWQAKNIYHLLISRFIIGIGHGYGVGQIKLYIRNLCSKEYATILHKLINPSIVVGIVLAYIMGLLVTFQTFSLITIFISATIFFVTIFVPAPPVDCVSSNNIKEAGLILNRTKPTVCVNTEIARLRHAIMYEETCGVMTLLKTKDLRENLTILSIMTFVQQFCGAPATIVYCQFMFRELHVPYPQFCAIIYAFVFLATIIITSFVSFKYNKKVMLIISSTVSVIALVTNAIVVYLDVNVNYFEYTSFIIMLVFIIAHTLGLGSVPLSFPEYLFPKKARTAATHWQLMLFSIFAVIITKLFQVFYSVFNFYLVFCLFGGVGIFGLAFIILFVPFHSPIEEN